MSVLHQNSGGIGKSISSALEISLDPRDFPRASPSGNFSGLGNSFGRRGWISQYLPCLGGARIQSSIYPTILHISYNPPHLMLSLLNNSRVSCHSEAGSSKEPPLTNEPLQKAGKCEIGSTPRLPKRITWQPPISEQLPSSFSTLYSGLSKVISSLLTFVEQSLLG